MSYGGTLYYFRKNLQGDVTGIYNATGTLVVEYEYTPYGAILSTTGSMANTIGTINPFRYRGYYYDTETGFYYLQTRYYDPEVGRFLNADILIGANEDLLGYNSFAYCSNNPIMYSDPCGTCKHNDDEDKKCWKCKVCGWVSDKAEAVGTFISDTIGVAVSTTAKNKNTKDSVDVLYYANETGEETSRLLAGNDSKTVTLYSDVSLLEVGGSDIGARINSNNKFVDIAFSAMQFSIEAGDEKASAEVFVGGWETGLTIYGEIENEDTALRTYRSVYIRPLPIVITAVIVCNFARKVIQMVPAMVVVVAG